MRTADPLLPISAVVCTYERHGLMAEAIASLRAQTLPEDRFETLIVDNSPPSARRERARSDHDGQGNVRYITVDTPGLANARNVAAREANGEVLAYLDDDALAEPQWLEEILRAYEAFGDQAGVVGGRVDPIWTVERPAWLSDSMLSALTVVNHGDKLRPTEAGEWVAGANFSVRQRVLLEAGGFPTSLGRVGGSAVLLSNEDSAMVQRLEDAGYKTIWAPAAAVRHRVDPERVSTAWFRRRYAWQAVSDFVADPAHALDIAERQWANVARFMDRLPPRLRTPRGLFEDFDDPSLIEDQINVTYSATVLLLAGYGLDPQRP